MLDATVDPAAYRVVDGRLYLNANKDVQKRWLDDVPGNIAAAEKNWPTLKDKVPKGSSTPAARAGAARRAYLGGVSGAAAGASSSMRSSGA